MGANRNHDEERRAVWGRLFSDLDHHAFDADCGSPNCNGSWLVPIAKLIPVWGSLRVSEAVKRLRCRHCGRPAEGVTFRRLIHPGRRSPNDLCVDLVGRRTDAGGR